jgi:two-component system response regulator RegX3
MTTAARLLIVEDEAAIRAGLEDVFVFHGYAVQGTGDGREGLRLALSGQFDLVLLDVMLPGMDGFEICDRIRAQDPRQAIIMLTARTSDEDIIQGLRLGADDYVAKPFSVGQLVLRVEAVLRRSRPDEDELTTLRLGSHGEVDLRNFRAEFNGEQVQFTRREIDLLTYLARHGDRPVPREELLHKVWGYARDAGIETRTVDIHVAKLRRKIEPDASEPTFLLTVRGAGYRLKAG